MRSLLPFSFTDLNTSHVLIYPKEATQELCNKLKFKYISCSYLSEKNNKTEERGYPI